MNTDIVEYQAHEAAIADIQRFKGLVVDTSTPSGLAEGKAAQRQVAAVRIALDKARKKLKEDVLERGRQIDGQAKPLFARVAEIEEPIDAQIEAFTKREEREKAAAIEAEKQKIIAEQAALKAAEEKRMADERAELARQRAALEAEQRARYEVVHQERLKLEQEQREARAKIEAEERTARLAREEADRAAKAVRDAEEAKAKQLRDAEDARLKAERDALEAKRREVEAAERKKREAAEAKAKAERDAKEAIEREAKRKEVEKSDAAGMWALFKSRYGHLPQYYDAIIAFDAACAEVV